MIRLRDWQQQAWNAWMSNNCRGIITAATGSGKSHLFLKMIEAYPESKILIVVPTQHLMIQHKELIETTFPELRAGLIGDGLNDERRVSIAIINSVRERKLDFNILVGDECHRMFSCINSLIFRNCFDKIMLLTATLEREDGAHEQFIKDLSIVYSINQGDCIKQRLLCSYTLNNVAINLTPEELEEYNEADEYVKEHFKDFKSMSNVLKHLYHPVARQLNRAIQKRKSVVLNARNKLKFTAKLLLETPERKTIVFCEFKKSADVLHEVLKDKIKVGLYHSGLKMKERRSMLERFKNDELKTLITVKCLDEGLNVVNCERAIIVGGSSVERQFLQRVGRILRPSGEKTAEVLQLYAPLTKDEDWAVKRIEGIDKSLVKVSFTSFINQS